MESKHGPFQVSGGDFCDKSPFCAGSHSCKCTIDNEYQNHQWRRAAESKSEIYQRKCQIAAYEQTFSSDPVRQLSKGNCQNRGCQVIDKIQQNSIAAVESKIRCAKQQKCVGRVSEGEQERNKQIQL